MPLLIAFVCGDSLPYWTGKIKKWVRQTDGPQHRFITPYYTAGGGGIISLKHIRISIRAEDFHNCTAYLSLTFHTTYLNNTCEDGLCGITVECLLVTQKVAGSHLGQSATR